MKRLTSMTRSAGRRATRTRSSHSTYIISGATKSTDVCCVTNRGVKVHRSPDIWPPPFHTTRLVAQRESAEHGADASVVHDDRVATVAAFHVAREHKRAVDNRGAEEVVQRKDLRGTRPRRVRGCLHSFHAPPAQPATGTPRR